MGASLGAYGKEDIVKKLGAAVLLWASGILGSVLAFAAVIYIHENQSTLEEPAIFALLVIGVALIGVAWRTRISLAENLALWAGVACLCLSSFFAIVHGWQTAVYIGYFIVALAYFLGVIWFLRRSVRRLRQDASIFTANHLGEPSKQAILADAAEPYILYPAKWKIARVLVILLMLTAVLGGVCVWALTLENTAVPALVSLFLAAFCGIVSLSLIYRLIYRLISRKPALVLTHLGLIDGASALYSGVGPIWWDEVAYVSIFTTPKAPLRPAYRYLDITPVDARSILRRQPPVRRFLLRLFSPILFTWLDIRIPAWMLGPSLEAVLEQTEHYAQENIKRRLEEAPPTAMEQAPGE
jgi:hypothetical protein